MDFTGGIHYGQNYNDAKNATWPFAYLHIDEIRLRVGSVFRPRFTFHKEDIITVSRYDGHFSTGLCIEHINRHYPPFVVFLDIQLHEGEDKLDRMRICSPRQ